MLTVLAILRLLGGHLKKHFNQAQVKVEQEGSMKNQKVTLPPLGVPGKLKIVQCQIGMTLDTAGTLKQGLQGFPLPFHDKSIGSSYGFQDGCRINWQHQ